MEGKYIIEVTIKKASPEVKDETSEQGFDLTSLMKYAPAILEGINKINQSTQAPKKEAKK